MSEDHQKSAEDALPDRELDTRIRRRGSRYVLWGVAVAALFVIAILAIRFGYIWG